MGCPCQGQQANARAAVQSGSVDKTVEALKQVFDPATLAPPKKAQPSVGYQNGVFVQTGKKVK